MYWCLGMYASGSTWTFNAALKIGAALFPGRRVASGFIGRAADIPAATRDDPVTILKSHDTDDETALEMSLRADIIWISIRDPRDCITSWMRYQSWTFEEALVMIAESAKYCQYFAADPRSRLFRYEDGFIGDIATLDRIAEDFGTALPSEDRSRIFAETRRSSIEKHIAQLDTQASTIRFSDVDDLVDPVMQWHTHHANRDGEIGRWRHVLSVEQVAAVEQKLGAWLQRFGYGPGDANAGHRDTRSGLALSDASRTDLCRALERYDKSGPLTVVVASDPYAHLLDNWLCHAEAIGLTRFLVIAMDDALLAKLVQAGIPAARCDFDGSAGDFWLQRLFIWEFVVLQGYDLIQSDIDAIWLRDPIDDFFNDSRYDFICTQGTAHPYDVAEVWGFVLCTGLFWIRAGKAAERFFSAVLAHAALIRETDDQDVMNHVLMNHGVSWMKPETGAYVEYLDDTPFQCYPDILTGECASLGLRIGLLPHRLFPRLPTAGPGAYVKHVLRPGDGSDRLEGLRASGCWMLDGPKTRLGVF